ncbi:cation transporter [Kushneria phosphatilytica]|uniref:Cation transporter n=1 Tax=Kushneria phosphatilytica TaxID=657387 RepID=A0A5C1A077_9GAMM|nr:cation diffusion facilitator family transporter [Kushneria phosphatilytica]QEL11568.1 cation transporter [Kushneria phosphatilytica]
MRQQTQHPSSHGAHQHEHDHVGADNERRVVRVMILTGMFMLAEVVGGWWSGSLALLADAGHMFSDSASLLLALVAFRLARRSPDHRRTYGYERFQVLAAFVNALALLAVVGWIVVTAIKRLFMPVPVGSQLMLVIALLGLVVNVMAFFILHHGDRANLNLRGALVHVIGDLLGSVAAIAASLIIMLTGWTLADPLLSLLAAALILNSAVKVLRRSTHVLLEGIPEGVDIASIRRELMKVEGVEEVHDLHVWALTAQSPLFSAHLVADAQSDRDELMKRAQSCLKTHFGLTHTTLQVESQICMTGGNCDAHVSLHES